MKKTKNYAMPYPEQDDYFNVEDFQDMMVSVDDLMKKLSDSGAQISSDAEHLYNQTKAQMDNIQKRMNAFTALRDGSTTGDAELKDIRVAYDGKEYGNAGEAVREQASDIHKALFGAGASIWSKAKSESTKYVAETKGICILNERFTAAGVVTKISRGTFAENESTLNLDRECSAYIVEFEKNPGTVYMPSAETIKIVSTTKIIFEANGNARCWIPVEKGQYLAVDSTATAYTSESDHVPYMLYDQANETLECRGFGSAGSIEPVDPYSLALEYKLEYDMDDTGLVKQIDANREAAASLKEDLAYKINSRLTPVQFETVLGYYAFDGFVSGKKEWGARLMRVPCKKGDKYLYHGYSDNIYGVSFLDSEFGIIRQIHVPKNKEFEMDVNVIDNASYIDFYSANMGVKTYVLKYNTEDTINNDVGKIFVDTSSQLIETDDKYFTPTVEELVHGAGMKLKEITPENDTVFKFSFTQHQAATAYVDEFCIVTSGDYQNGTEVFYENIIVFVPKGKTLRINDFKSDVYVSKFEKLVPITEEYINKKIPNVPKTVDAVMDGVSNPVSSNAVYHAIKTNTTQVSTGLPYIAVASSEAPTAIKSVCQFICDGTDDNIEIQNAINSLGSAGGKVFLTKGKFFISQPIETGNILIELCGEGALLDLREDTSNSPDRGGTILQAVGNTDLLHIGGAKGTTVHDIAFFGYGRNKVDNTSYGIRFIGYADTDRIYNCGFTNCAVAIGADIQTDVLYIHNLSVQRNKVGICLYRSDAEVHDCLFCENIGMENVSWDSKTYNINCADICVNDGKIYNNTFRRSGMCYDIFKVYGNESGLESDDVRPVSSIVLLGCARIIGNYFFDQIYANCIRVMSRTDFVYIEGNSFTKWGHKDQTDDCRKSAICFDAGSVLGTIMNNRFYSDSNTEKFTDKYAIYENNTDGDNSYWRYSNTYMNNFIGNLTADTENKCRIIGTAPQNQFINNIVVNR